MALKIKPSPQDFDWMFEDSSWCNFDSMIKYSTSHTIPPHEEDYKWRLVTEVLKVFNEALKVAFHDFPEKCRMLCCKRDDGEFQCDNVLSIWPKIVNSNSYPDVEEPKDVGERIKETLVEQKSCMIEGEPRVHDGGFVTIKLSGNWMIESIHKMLRDGIDTWAPRQEFEFKTTIINSPSWDESNLMPMDVLRRQLIIISRMHMLEYVKSVGTTSSGNGMSLPPDMDDHFKTVEKDGEVLIYRKDEANMEPLVRGKSRKSNGKKDGCRGYALEDLGALWHGLVNEKSDWIVCVTPSQKQDYIEDCFNAAEHAGWTTDTFWPLASYVGFKTCSTSLESLLSFSNDAEYPCEAGEAAKVLGYTHEAVLDCALMYTFLKYHRLADCKFSYNEMLDIKGDTFVHLLKTQAQIRKITDHYRKDIDELMKASKQVLEANKVVCCEGVERELRLHLLMFTELINESYLSFLPHLLCLYLYNLSEKFSRVYETYSSSGFKEKTTLLLCEATAVVMEKGFHLLGITQKPSLQVVSAALALNSVVPLELIRNPLKTPNIRTRFEVFTTYIDITRYDDFEEGKLFGCIQLSDYYGLLPDGWAEMDNPGPGFVSLLSRNWSHPIEMRNYDFLEIGNPSCRHSVPFSSSMEMCILLYATTNNKDHIFEVCNYQSPEDFSRFLKSGSKSSCEEFVAGGDYGNMGMHYILLRDAIDARIKVKFCRLSDRKVRLVLLGYYGDNFDYGDNDVRHYKASLYSSVLEAEDVPLTRSVLAVPKDGSLIIDARLTYIDSGDVILDEKLEFSVNCEGSIDGDFKCNDCSLKVEITWSNYEDF